MCVSVCVCVSAFVDSEGVCECVCVPLWTLKVCVSVCVCACVRVCAFADSEGCVWVGCVCIWVGAADSPVPAC